MSDSDTKVQNEPLEEVVIDNDDASNILEFFSHFDIEVPDYLKSAVDNFSKAIEVPEAEQDKLQILQLQNEVRINLCRTFVEHPTPIFKDEIFNVVVENSKSISFESFFKKQLEDECTKD